MSAQRHVYKMCMRPERSNTVVCYFPAMMGGSEQMIHRTAKIWEAEGKDRSGRLNSSLMEVKKGERWYSCR